jgi:hypothetical protein
MAYAFSIVLGLVASGLLAAISYSSHNRTITILSAVMSAVVCAQYVLLNHPGAAVLSAISLIFSIASLMLSRVRAWRPKVALAAMILSMVAAHWVVNDISVGYETLPLVGSVLMASLICIHNRVAIKTIQFIAGIVWTIYQVHVSAWGQMPGEVIYFVAWWLSVTPGRTQAQGHGE